MDLGGEAAVVAAAVIGGPHLGAVGRQRQPQHVVVQVLVVLEVDHVDRVAEVPTREDVAGDFSSCRRILPRSTLFPYTTLFRSEAGQVGTQLAGPAAHGQVDVVG